MESPCIILSPKKVSDATSPPPIPARIWKIAAATGVGAFIAMLDSTVANLAIESIRNDLHSTLPVIQWVATGYLIALAVSLPRSEERRVGKECRCLVVDGDE